MHVFDGHNILETVTTAVHTASFGVHFELVLPYV
jgi:hypothetical protein